MFSNLYRLVAVIGIGLAWCAGYSHGALKVTEAVPWYVTSDTSGSHTTTPGTPAFGVNIDGVADLIVTRTDGTFRGTGALLLNGDAVLTAAHVVTNTSGTLITSNVQATWHLASGNVTQNSSTIIVHPLYNGDATEANDLAIVVFGSPVNPLVPRYDIYRGSGEISLTSVKAGYGQSGIGSVGATTASGTKRAGLNEYDRDARDVLSALGGGVNPFDGGPLPAAGLSIAYDFDSGNPDNNTFTYSPINYGSDLGFGADEVGSAPGDSGGPTFILDSGIWKIAGVTSYGFGFTGLPDANPGTNSSWGEVAVDMRVAGYQSFLNSYVPEPASLWMLALGGAALLRRRCR